MNRMTDCPNKHPCVDMLALCIGDGTLAAMDYAAKAKQQMDNVVWLGYNTDSVAGSWQESADLEQKRQEAKQSIEAIIREYPDIEYALILAVMDESISTITAELIPVIAKAFREHGIKVIGAITTGFPDIPAGRRESVKKKTEELRAQTDLLLTFPGGAIQEELRAPGKLLWQVAQCLIAGLWGKSLINLDLEDIQNIFKNGNQAYIVTSSASKLYEAAHKAKNALSSLAHSGVYVKDLVVSIVIPSETIDKGEIDEAIRVFPDFRSDGYILWACSISDGSQPCITVIAAGET